MDTSNVTFGADHFRKDTPKQVKLWYQILMFVTFMWMFGIEPRVGISDALAHQVDVWMAIANLGIYFFCQCFGYKMPDKIEAGNPNVTPSHSVADDSMWRDALKEILDRLPEQLPGAQETPALKGAVTQDQSLTNKN